MSPDVPSGRPGRVPGAYRYHDPCDVIPGAGITPGRVSAERGWDESDHSLIRQAVRRLPGERATTCADVGAGRGRLLKVLAEVAERITLIEPDAGRLDAARGVAAGLGHRCWQFVQADLTSAGLTDERFELVVCSHVIQHLAIGQRADFMARLRDMIAPAGLLVLMFPGTLHSPGRLLLSLLEPGKKVVTRRATPAEFDAAAGACGPRGGVGNDVPVVLPVWHAAPGEVETLLAGAGLRVMSRSAYRKFTFQSTEGGGVHPRRAWDVCILASPLTGRVG